MRESLWCDRGRRPMPVLSLFWLVWKERSYHGRCLPGMTDQVIIDQILTELESYWILISLLKKVGSYKKGFNFILYVFNVTSSKYNFFFYVDHPHHLEVWKIDNYFTFRPTKCTYKISSKSVEPFRSMATNTATRNFINIKKI